MDRYGLCIVPKWFIGTILGIGQLHFLRKAEILRDIKKLFIILTEGRDFTNNDEAPSLPEMFDKVKRVVKPIRGYFYTLPTRMGHLVKKLNRTGK